MAQAQAAVRSRYAGAAGQHYHRRVHWGDEFTQTIVAKERRQKLQPYVAPDDILLEYGAGMCVNLRFLECRRKVAYDVSDVGREIASQVGIEYVTDVALLRPHTFSVIICHHALEHVPDPFAVLEQIRDLLQPGGHLVLCVPFETNRSFRRYWPNNPDQHLFSWNALTLGNLVAAVGLNVIRSKPNPFGYEQRLAVLARAGMSVYRAGLWIVRHLRPANEVLLLAVKREPATAS